MTDATADALMVAGGAAMIPESIFDPVRPMQDAPPYLLT